MPTFERVLWRVLRGNLYMNVRVQTSRLFSFQRLYVSDSSCSASALSRPRSTTRSSRSRPPRRRLRTLRTARRRSCARMRSSSLRTEATYSTRSARLPSVRPYILIRWTCTHAHPDALPQPWARTCSRSTRRRTSARTSCAKSPRGLRTSTRSCTTRTRLAAPSSSRSPTRSRRGGPSFARKRSSSRL